MAHRWRPSGHTSASSALLAGRANPALNGGAYARKIPVKANLDARAADPAVALLAWDFYALRRAWNQAKDQVAPWWRCSSKEAYASGIADLVTALGNWSDAKAGRRAGRPVGFPRFKARRRDRDRVRCTTGAMRLEPDRRHLVLPVMGKLRSKENTRRLERLVAKGRARACR